MSSGYWLGVDLGGTKILCGLFDDNLKLLARSKQPTSAESGPEEVIGRIVRGVDAVVSEAKIDPNHIRGMALGVPGQVVPGGSIVKYAPNLNWHDVDIQQHMPAAWRFPLLVENDVLMVTYGEFAHGAAKGARNVFGIFVGTGVGGGLILNGDLFIGFNGNAGEIGHMIVHWRRGSELEGIAGRKYMMKRAEELLADSPKRVRKEWKHVDLKNVRSSQLAEFYQKDDPIAVQIVDDAARALGAAIGSVVNLLSPEVIVVGGGVTGALGDTFIERIWEFAQRYCLPKAADGVRCVATSLGDDSGIVGCAAYAMAHLPARAAVVA